MKLSKLIYKRKLSILGILIFLILGSIKLAYYILSNVSIKIYQACLWIYRYVKLCKTGYSYSQIEKMVEIMSPREFEKFCYYILREKYDAKLTPPSNDYGRDIILKIKDINKNTVGKKTIYVEVKHYSKDNYVGREIVQKLSGAMSMFHANSGIIINTGSYNKNAYESATMIGNIKLWTLDNLMLELMSIDPKQIPKILIGTFGTDSKVINISIPSLNQFKGIN